MNFIFKLFLFLVALWGYLVYSDQPTTSYKQIKVKTKDWGPKYSALENLFGKASQDRKELADLREKHISLYLAMRDQENPNFVDLAYNITTDTMAYIQKRIQETMNELGAPPTDFCVFTMGSMARDESGFFTDLEIGILVKEKNVEVLKYFQTFAQKLSDRFFLLGEHPDVGGKGLRMDEADNSPAHLKFFARYACPQQVKTLLQSALEKRQFDKIPFEGSRIFVATPEEFALHSSPDYALSEPSMDQQAYQKVLQEELQKALQDPANKRRTPQDIEQELEPYIKTLVKPLSPREKQIAASATALTRNIRFLFGDEKLFELYLQLREKYLSGPPRYSNPNYSNRRQEIAYLELKKDIIKYMNKPDSAIVMGKLGKEIDIKRELYRFPEQVLTNLGFWYDTQEQNTSKIAQKLAQEGLMSLELSTQLQDAINYFIGLRLKKQEVCRKQTTAVPTTLEEFEEQTKDLETELQQAKNEREFLVKTNSVQSDIDTIDQKISKLQLSLINLQKLKPLGDLSILDQQEITLLNTKYVPFLKNLFQIAKDFISGNKQAFIEFKVTEQASVQPNESSAIALKDLEVMVQENQVDKIKDALEKGLIDVKQLSKLASQYKQTDIMRLAFPYLIKKVIQK